jgi:large subunit ribosomal protein L25
MRPALLRARISTVFKSVRGSRGGQVQLENRAAKTGFSFSIDGFTGPCYLRATFRRESERSETMENILNVEPRESNGKGGARKLRRQGRIPGVLYGHKEKALAMSLDPHLLRKQVTKSGYGRNTVLHVKGLERDVLALLKATQVDPVRRNLLHIDLIEVREDEQVEVTVPVVYEGRALGVRSGGSLQIIRRQLRVKTTPLNIPKHIVVDVTDMDVNYTCHASDISMPDGVVLRTSTKVTLLNVAPPPVAEVATEAEEGEGEGEDKSPAESAK